jgi:NAD(P)-dependent dehydrogenase (short-subunit alcohol dehydrogenase family)
MTEQIDIPASFAGAADVTGKRMVITGAGRGLGRLLAHAFSRDGARVALVARTETDLKTVAEELPGPALVLAGDVTDENFNEAVADATEAEWGGVDVWICNAGISPVVAGPRETDPVVWREILDVNLTGAFLGARAAARVMHEGGRLIFTGSVLGERPRAGLTAYSASKAGLVGLAKGLALDLASAGITVNVVAPGWFDSPLAERWKKSPDLEAGVLGHTAQRRWGAAGDLAGAYQFLASAASAFVTGTVINVDGGYLLV